MSTPLGKPARQPDTLPHLHAATDVSNDRRDEILHEHHHDIAELRRLTERFVHLAAVIEFSDDAIFGKTLDGVITSWNYGAERMYGYRPEEIVGRSVEILFPPDRPDEFDRIMSRLRRGERIDHFETVRVRKDGTRLDVSVTISPLRDDSGRLIGVASIGRDISERKQLEKRRMAFAAAASHELKTPITVQKMAVQALRRAVERGNEEAVVRLVERIESSLDRQTRLVNELLDLSRLEQGVLVARPARFRLDEVVRDTAGQLGGLSHHELVVEAPAPVDVEADPDQVGQILVNLITNAIKYSPEADRVEITVSVAHDHATMAVRDFGPGLAPADHARVFDAFVRVDGGESGGLSGLGVGLYLATQLSTLQGGRLRLESSPGKGATFILELPLPMAEDSGRD